MLNILLNKHKSLLVITFVYLNYICNKLKYMKVVKHRSESYSCSFPF